MKRQGYLLDQIADLSNLELAFYKAQKGKSKKASVERYAQDLYANLKQLREQILSGAVEAGGYHFFIVYDPKKRQICAAPFEQRVLHHALMNVCHPFFEKWQINDSYASRLGKGTYAALEKAKTYTRNYAWYLKLDVRKYFDSIDHAVLRSQLCRMFKDASLLGIFDRIISSYEAAPYCGVPIGNLTSQYFANHYLTSADHYAKEKLKVPAYVRYMDDMVLWHSDKPALIEAGHQYAEYLKCSLNLELKPFCLNRNDRGLPFLGYLLYPGQTLLAQRSRKRYIQKMVLYRSFLKSGTWTQRDYQRHVLPLTAFTWHAEAKGFRAKVNQHREIE